MKKAEFIKEVATKADKTQKEVKELLEIMQDVVFDTVKAEDEVKVFDGITITSVYREAHEARNPMDGSKVMVEAKRSPKAKFGSAFKAAINA